MVYSIPSASTKSFQNASSYDKHRPSYRPEAVTRFLKQLKVHGVKRARLVDLAAGTGKFTELLVGRDEDFEILAVEPHNGTQIDERSTFQYVPSSESRHMHRTNKFPLDSFTLYTCPINEALTYYEENVLTAKNRVRHEDRVGKERVDGCEGSRRRG